MQIFANTPRSCVELYTRAHAEGDEEDEVEEEDEEGPELHSAGNIFAYYPPARLFLITC